MNNTFAIVNQKGGVAKTTTTVNLAYELADLGKNTDGSITLFRKQLKIAERFNF